jgi:hypothetical protein
MMSQSDTGGRKMPSDPGLGKFLETTKAQSLSIDMIGAAESEKLQVFLDQA